MKHLGDISKINGAEIEPVDIITFGSPCQDLSVAGKRAGLEGARSGLFMEAVRIIKEMREATNGQYPRFALWENVPGAFSSNKGEDFRVVLEELIKIAEPGAALLEVPPFGWAYADSYVGDGWSLAYRVFDTQYWPRTPQRRRRIYLVADFRGQCAREVLFEREGLRGHLTESPAPRERITAYVEVGPGAADQAVAAPRAAAESDIAATLCATYGTKWNGNAGAYNGENFVLAVATQQGGAEIADNGICPTVTAAAGTSGNNQPWVTFAIDQQGGKGGANYAEEVMPTLCSDSHGTPHAVAYGISSYDSNAMKSDNPHSGIYEADTSRTLDLNGGNPACNQGGIAIVEATGIDTYNGAETGEKAATLGVNCGMSTGRNGVIAVALQRGGAEFSEDGIERECVAEKVVYKADDGSSGPIAPCLVGDHNNRVTDHTALVVEPIPIHNQATRFSGKRGDKQDGKGNGLGVGEPGGPMNTLTEGDRHAVMYWDGGQVCGTLTANNAGGKQRMPDKENFNCVIEQQPNGQPGVAYATDVGFFNSLEEQSPTLLARGYKDPHLITCAEDMVHYIVRRLTPTECARLQGFPDTWGHPNKKEELTDEEYGFWLDVRNTHATINGKAVKEYTKDQMLKWYNKLHSDSAEYKMWGNGIALPPTLYCMQGITDALNKKMEEK